MSCNASFSLEQELFLPLIEWTPLTPWSTCSAECGKGVTYRQWTCTDNFNNIGINNAYCKARHGDPIEQKECEIAPCPGTAMIFTLLIFKFLFLFFSKDNFYICSKASSTLVSFFGVFSDLTLKAAYWNEKKLYKYICIYKTSIPIQMA